MKIISIVCFGLVLTHITCSTGEYGKINVQKKRTHFANSNPIHIIKAKKILKDLNFSDHKPTNSNSTHCPKPAPAQQIVNSPNDSLDLVSTVEAEKLFYGAEVVSKEHFTYGKFVARMKPAHVRGTVSAFFLYNSENQEEFDVEVLGGHEKIVPTIHPCRIYKDVPLTLNTMKEFHDYTMEWTPNSVRWLIDEIPIFELKTHGNYSSKKRIILSTSVTKDWDGEIDFKAWKEHKVSYEFVKYYPYLEQDGTFASVPTWEDTFTDSLDLRWGRTSTNGPSPFSHTEHNLKNITQVSVGEKTLLELLLTRKTL